MSADTQKGHLKEDLRALFRCPRELWIAYIAKFFESIGLFSLLYTATLWLSADYGLTDVEAGWWFGAFSLVLSLITFCVGFFADAVGFRPTLIFAFFAAAVARGTMAFAGPSRRVALIGFMGLTLGTALGVPVLNTAIRRYTTVRARPFGFSLYYALMNVGAAVAGLLLDIVRGHFKGPEGKPIAKLVMLPLLGERMMSTYSMIYLIGLGCAVLAFTASLFLRRGVDAEADELRAFAAAAPDAELEAVEGAGYREAAKARKVLAEKHERNPFKVAWSVLRESTFWRFMLFIALLVPPKLIYQHYHATWPKYVLREMGESFPIGKIFSVNPLIIMFLVPITTALTKKYPVFRMILIGSLVSSASVFLLCINASYPTIIGMLLVLTLGEALWLPRLYEYTAAIAPRGRESSYMSLSALPMFFAKMIVGPMGGYLLATYCPETGPRNSEMMWLIIGLTTIGGPILIYFFRGVIEHPPKAGRQPEGHS
ncbi:hypothetical protein BH09MYX1_BH09MYX1_47760 [soil metagenome]